MRNSQRGRQAHLTIETPEGVVFSFELATPVTRGLAWAVDAVAIAAASSVAGQACRALNLLSADWANGVSVVGYFVISIVYAIVLEWRWRGQTLGKRLFGLRVIDVKGLRLQLPQIAMRNLLRLVDVLPLFYLVGGLTAVFSRNAQRLGDMAANTVVTRERKVEAPDIEQIAPAKYNSLLAQPHLAARLRSLATPEVVALAVRAVTQRDGYDPLARIPLFRELAAYFRGLVQFPEEAVEGLTDEQYVRSVLRVIYGSGKSVETAILDLEQEPPAARRRWPQYLIGAFTGMAIVRWAKIDALWWIPVFQLSIAVHEVGHLLAAKFVGMETGGIVVGGFALMRSGDLWVFRFRFRNLLSGGIAKPLPDKGAVNLNQYVVMVAGGPIATALLIAGAGIANWRSTEFQPWLATLLWINILLFGALFLPGDGLNKSDFPRIWFLLRQPAEARSWIALLQVQTQDTIGILPRDWDAGLFDRMMQYDPRSGDYSFRELLAFCRYIDQGENQVALRHLEIGLASRGGNKLIRQCFFLEAATSCSLLRGNPAAARTWLQRAARLRKLESTRSVEASIAQGEQRYDDAIRLWDEARAYLEKRKLDSGLARLAKEKIAEYRRQCVDAIASAG